MYYVHEQAWDFSTAEICHRDNFFGFLRKTICCTFLEISSSLREDNDCLCPTMNLFYAIISDLFSLEKGNSASRPQSDNLSVQHSRFRVEIYEKYRLKNSREHVQSTNLETAPQQVVRTTGTCSMTESRKNLRGRKLRASKQMALLERYVNGVKSLQMCTIPTPSIQARIPYRRYFG